MATQQEYAEHFEKLHIKGNPLILYNAWDAGTASVLTELGAKAIATGSWSAAAAQGYGDGQDLPLELVTENLKRIVRVVDLPVSLDFEGGYAEEPALLKKNIVNVIEAGAVGINFEDQVVGTDEIYAIDVQASRIGAIREVASERNLGFFINARTDLFLKNDPESHADHIEEAIKRAHAYAESGASGFFVPGLRDAELIARICEESPLPVNLIKWPGTPSSSEMAELGVARISHGGNGFHVAMNAFKDAAIEALTFRD